MSRECRNEYISIDIMKFVLAFLVVAIHTDPLYSIQGTILYRIWGTITSLAVPLFFVSTGFLMESRVSKSSHSEEIGYCLNKAIAIAKLYIVWCIIYLPLAIVKYIGDDASIKGAIIDYLRGLILYGEHYNSYILWYLLSLFYTLVYIFFLRRYSVSKCKILIVGSIIMAVGVSITAYSLGKFEANGVLSPVYSLICRLLINGRIFTGFFYVPLGMCIYNWYKAEKRKSVLLYVLGIVILILLRSVSDYESIKELLRALLAILCFYVVLGVDAKSIASTHMKYRSYSSTIYFIHLYVWTILYWIIYGKRQYGVLIFIATSIVSLIAAIIVENIKAKMAKERKNDSL